MPRRVLLTLSWWICSRLLFGQASTYTSYFTGNPSDTVTTSAGGVCLMGGSTEDDDAMRWFLQRANGGDVLVLRASGSNGYNNYLYSELGIPVNSVETIVCHSAASASETYIHQKIMKAEAIWFAGGDQWRYISYWRGTAIDSLINRSIQERNIVIGGTSAGMAILGGFYFTAQNGTITSNNALNNPFHNSLMVDSSAFIKAAAWLKDVITDTHYDNPVRKGRHVVFLSRILNDYGTSAKGIACNERTAVCISPEGIARVFGRYPQNNSHEAFFLQINCEVIPNTPENISNNVPLTWIRENKAIKVCRIKGTPDGANSINLNDWRTTSGGVWENWWVNNGVLNEQSSEAPDCNITHTLPTTTTTTSTSTYFYPIPAHRTLRVSTKAKIADKAVVYDQTGRAYSITLEFKGGSYEISTTTLPKNQILMIRLSTDQGYSYHKICVAR